MHQFYEDVRILPPLQPDIEGVGKGSDHSTPFLKVHMDASLPRKTRKKIKTVRPMVVSGIEIWNMDFFFNFSEVSNKDTSDKKDDKFWEILLAKVEETGLMVSFGQHNLGLCGDQKTPNWAFCPVLRQSHRQTHTTLFVNIY